MNRAVEMNYTYENANAVYHFSVVPVTQLNAAK